jgi:Flp pilus assembly CpaF family ATPase
MEAAGVLNAIQLAQLDAAIRARANIVVCGSTDSGMRALMRSLVSCAVGSPPTAMRSGRTVVLTRRADDYPLPHETVRIAPGHCVSAFVEALHIAQKMTPERLVIDEVLAGSETVYALKALYRGRGGLVMVHGEGGDALERLTSLIGQDVIAGADPGIASLLVGENIDIVVAMNPRARHRDRSTAITIHRAADLARARARERASTRARVLAHH